MSAPKVKTAPVTTLFVELMVTSALTSAYFSTNGAGGALKTTIVSCKLGKV
jgi:hypothetical protein